MSLPKRCSKCREAKARSDFSRDRRNKDGLRSQCKQCSNDVSRRWRSANPTAGPASTRRWRLAKTYEISEGDYLAMLLAQGGGCAVCGSVKPGGRGSFHVDHDHRTGKVRALLCLGCNTGLGAFKDDPVLLEAAAAYLRMHKEAG